MRGFWCYRRGWLVLKGLRVGLGILANLDSGESEATTPNLVHSKAARCREVSLYETMDRRTTKI